MFGIKKKIKKAAIEVIKELYEEYVKDGKIVVTPDLKNKGVNISFKKEV